MTTPTPCSVLVRRLGRVSYSVALALQQSLVTRYKGKQPHGQVGELVLCEHDPVFTFGLRETNYEIRAAKLKQLGCDVHKVRRGGLTTFHGPGQLVCYPVLNLRQLKVGVRDYVKCLERAALGTLQEFGVEGYTTDNTGVWVDHPLKGESKICSIGSSPKCRYSSEPWCELSWTGLELQHQALLVLPHLTMWSAGEARHFSSRPPSQNSHH